MMQNIPDKLRVVLGHLEAANVMMALDLGPKSIHLLLMAAEEITESYAKASGVELFISWKAIRAALPDPHGKQLHDLRSSAYNYFKHADRDTFAPYTGPSDGELTSLNTIIWYVTYTNILRLGVKPDHGLKLCQALCLVALPDYFLEADLPMSKLDRTKVLWNLPSTSQDSLRLGVYLRDNPDLIDLIHKAERSIESIENIAEAAKAHFGF